MISIEKLYAATDDGLRIICLHYPDAEQAVRKGEKFKARPDEKTPSAAVRLTKLKSGASVWKFIDFGDDNRSLDPIDVHCKNTGLTFTEAILDLAAIFNVTDELSRSVNKPEIRKCPATADQQDDGVYWDIDQNFTENECRVMGPRVTAEHLKALHWYRVNWIATVRNREATYKYPTENFPIFIRECWFTGADGKDDRFYKIYEPLNPEKQYRFQYRPKGKKPKSYVNGLYELARAYTKFNESEEKRWCSDPANDGKPYKEQKLPEAIICSGERDSLCARSLGYHPLWFNSETYDVSESEMGQITRYVEVVYNIPDIDETGRRRGTELALKYIDVHTIWLPEKLQKYRDNRGKPRKDFRDWMEIWKTNADFRALLNLASPARFWTESRDSKSGRKKYKIEVTCLYDFLRLHGFWRLNDKHVKDTVFIKIDGMVVRRVEAKDIRRYVYDWAMEKALVRDVRSLILTTPALSSTALEALSKIELNFDNFTDHSQTFFFPKFALEVTGDGIIKRDILKAETDTFVREEEIIQHDIRLLPDMFEITRNADGYDSSDFDIKVLPHGSNYFRYLINSSRLYWRKELENVPEGTTPAEKEAYALEHKFDIAGPRLDEDEIREQKQCLINKIFTIGYMLHRYKSDSRPWAPFLMDNLIGENDQCNGGSGKSFMLRSLMHMTKWLKLSGRNKKMLDGQFPFEQIDKSTDIVVVDDCDEYFPYKEFYDNITSDITINAKNISAYNLAYRESPKFAFTTNYVPKEFDPSTVRRMIFVVFSDYYHTATPQNDYLETRTIATDFKKNLFSESYSEPEWQADINFFLQCVRFYLSVAKIDVKIEPRIKSIIYRQHLREVSNNFREWAEVYFSERCDSGGGEHLDCEVFREDAMNDCIRVTNNGRMTPQSFKKQLESFCYTCEWIAEINPEEMCNSGKRIVRRRENPVTHKSETKEVIYIRSRAEAARLQEMADNDPLAMPKQASMFD